MLIEILVISVGSYVKLPLVGHLTEEKRLDFFFPRLIRSLIPAQVCFILARFYTIPCYQTGKANSYLLLISLSRE